MKNYKNIVHKFTGKDGQVYVNTVERMNQHGSRFYITLKVPEGYEVRELEQLDNELLKEWEVMAATASPYKKPLKLFKASVIK